MSDYEYFDLTEQHVKLLRHANVGWCGDEFGAPCIDPKRPYGNSDVSRHVADILGIDIETDPEFCPGMSERQNRELESLHRETRKALQVVLSSGSFEPGRYRSKQYRNRWELTQ
jgi:hypothetical protein